MPYDGLLGLLVLKLLLPMEPHFSLGCRNIDPKGLGCTCLCYWVRIFARSPDSAEERGEEGHSVSHDGLILDLCNENMQHHNPVNRVCSIVGQCTRLKCLT